MAGRRIKSALFVLVMFAFGFASYLQFVYTNSVGFSVAYASIKSRRNERREETGDEYETEADRKNSSRLLPPYSASGSRTAHVKGGTSGVAANDTLRSKIKSILLWTPKYGNADFGIGLGRTGFVRKGCTESRCYVTDNRSLVESVDAILFHAWDTTSSTMPSRGRPDQIWIFYSLESPLTVGRQIRGTNDKYNLTVTYLAHPDTDIVTRIRKLKRPVSELPSSKSVRRKTKMAVWPVSNCAGALSSRNDYAEELGNYVEIDLFGRCGNLSCPIDDKSGCYSKFESEYFFYLSFENSLCEQYITEKVYAVLRRNIVPVILGGGNYDETLPPNSYLDVRDFNSPRHLARYMTYLRKNTTAYLSYFAWKKDASYHIGEIEKRTPPAYGKGGAFCRLCEILHDEGYPYKRDFNVEEYWSAKKLCLSGIRERKLLHMV